VQQDLAGIQDLFIDTPLSFENLPGQDYQDGSATAVDASRSWADGAAAELETGGAGIQQYYPPTLND
jgi:hypothetical protein